MTIRFACEKDIPQMLDLLLQVGKFTTRSAPTFSGRGPRNMMNRP